MQISIKEKIKELFKHGIVYGMTSSLQNILAFLLLPILTVYYTPAEFGIYSIILLSCTLSNAIFYLGAGSALGRFYYEEDSESFRKNIIKSAFLITAFGATLLIFLSFIFSNKVSQFLFNDIKYSKHLMLALVGTSFGFLLNILTLILRYDKKSFLFMVVTISGVVLNFIITYVLLTYYQYGILAPIFGTLFSNLASLGILWIHYFNKISGVVYFKNIQLLLLFGLQSSITGVLFFLLDWIDRLIIKDLLPMADVGIYSLGYRIGSMINVLLIVPFSLVWAPLRMQYAKNDNNQIFVEKIITYFLVLGMGIVFISILFSDIFMNFFFSNKNFSKASTIFPITMLATLIYGLQNIVDFGIYIQKKLHFYIIISSFGLLINICLNYLLIPRFGFIAAAYVTLITYVSTTSLIYFVSNKYYKIRFEWKRVTIPLLLVLTVYILVNETPFLQGNSVMKKIFLLILFFIFIFRFWLSVYEKKQLLKFWKKCYILIRN